jgi:hypothetical protein
MPRSLSRLVRLLALSGLVLSMGASSGVPLPALEDLDLDLDPLVLPIVSTKGTELVATLPEAANATAINFLSYDDGRDVMVVVGRFGAMTYEVSDPANPVALGSIGNDALALPGESGTFWQSEDTDVDDARKLIFLSRDPRAYGGSTSTGTAGVYIIDAADPADLQLITFHELGAGHTASCINDCQYLWSGGPGRGNDQPSDWRGRPIFVTDVTDPANPVTFEQPIDLHRNDGRTDYSHDVQVDADGVAWVSGFGGVRGYWTEGEHHDPLLGEVREATAWDPIPYAGGGIAEDAAPSTLLHNSARPVEADAHDGHTPTDEHPAGSLVYGTEEAFTPNCVNGGNFVIASLEGSYDGQGWRSTVDEPFRLRTVGTWSPWLKEGMGIGASCSAHYFQLSDGIVAYAWYTQGVRFLDITDPTDPIQVAYFRPLNANAWAPYWHNDHVFIADGNRGVDIIRLTDEAEDAAADRAEVLAPSLPAEALARQAATLATFGPDPVLGWSCRVPVDL